MRRGERRGERRGLRAEAARGAPVDGRAPRARGALALLPIPLLLLLLLLMLMLMRHTPPRQSRRRSCCSAADGCVVPSRAPVLSDLSPEYALCPERHVRHVRHVPAPQRRRPYRYPYRYPRPCPRPYPYFPVDVPDAPSPSRRVSSPSVISNGSVANAFVYARLTGLIGLMIVSFVGVFVKRPWRCCGRCVSRV